jgi:hypothetical protein
MINSLHVFIFLNNPIIHILIHLKNIPKSHQLEVNRSNIAKLNNFLAIKILKPGENAFNLKNLAQSMNRHFNDQVISVFILLIQRKALNGKTRIINLQQSSHPTRKILIHLRNINLALQPRVNKLSTGIQSHKSSPSIYQSFQNSLECIFQQ